MTRSKRPNLERLFDELNALRFDGKLPRYRVRRRPIPADFNKRRNWGQTFHKPKRIILLLSTVTDEMLRRTMLHEMCHVECPDGPRIHGPCFMACLRRLAAVEPVLVPELVDYDENLPLPLYTPGISRTTVLSGAIQTHVESLAWSGHRQRWSTARRALAAKLDMYETGFDEEFPDGRAEWTRAIVRQRENQAAMWAGRTVDDLAEAIYRRLCRRQLHEGPGADMSLAELRLGLGVTAAQLTEAVKVLRLSDDLCIAFTRPAPSRVTLGASWRGRCEDETERK